MNTPAPSPYLDTRQAAAYLGLRPSTLEAWRTHGQGPGFKKFGRLVRYDRHELQAWAEQRHRVSTCDPGTEAG